METLVIYLRDEVIKLAVPHHYQPFVAFLVSMFFIILVVNLFGLIPGTGTMSGNIGMTCAGHRLSFYGCCSSVSKNRVSQILD